MRIRLRPLHVVFATGALAPAVAAGQGAGAPLPAPTVIIGRHASVVVGAPAALAAASDSAAVVQTLARCLPGYRDAAAVAQATAPAGSGMPDGGEHALVLVVPASDYLAASCDTRVLAGPALLARGIQFVGAKGYDARVDVVAATLVVDGRTVEPTDVERVPAHVIPPAPEARVPSWLVLALPSNVLAPDAGGRFPAVTLRGTSADGAAPESFSIPAEHLRALWYALIPRRLASSGEATAALDRLAAPGLSREDTRAARMRLATAALGAGDTAAARVVLGDVLADAPCLTISRTQPEYGRLVDAMRPPARCETIPARRILLRGLVPGLALRAVGRPRSAVINAGATLAAAGVGAAFLSSAHAAHERYMTARTVIDATDAWQRATDARGSARNAFVAAGAVWVGGVVHGLLTERAYGRELARVREYDRQPRVGVLPGTRGGAAVIAVSVPW